MTEVFGIAREYEDGQVFYSIRGEGQTYQRFYEWFRPNIRPITECDDWPWHVVTLSNSDEQLLYQNYGEYIYGVDDD